MMPHGALYWLALAAGIILTAVSQILLKVGATNKSTILRSFLNVGTLAGYSLFFVVTLLNVFAMRRIPLRTMTAASSITYVLTLALGHWMLRERLTWRMLAGVALILAGVIVYSISGVL